MKDILWDPLHMSHACHRFRKCYKNLTFSSLLTRCIIPEACQKCSESVSFLHFCLRNMLRATTACTFSTSQLPNLLRHWGVLCILHILYFPKWFVQHDPRNWPFMGFEGSHSAGEIGTGRERERERYIYNIYIYIYLYLFIYFYIYICIYLFICK